MGALILLTILLTTAWMGFDASKRDWSDSSFADQTWKWVLGGLLLWIAVFPAYFLLRDRAPLRTALGTGPAYPPAPAPDGWIEPSAAGSVAPPSSRD